MRAVEEGRYLVRSANTGISGIVDPYGRVLARTTLFTPVAMVGTVRFLTDRTLYARFGDSSPICASRRHARRALAAVGRSPAIFDEPR